MPPVFRLAVSLGLAALVAVQLGGPQQVVGQEPDGDGSVSTSSARDSERGWLGIAFRDRPALGPRAGGADSRSDQVVISGVLRGGPADRAGIRPGDVLLGMEGEPVGPDGLTSIAREIRVGDSISLTVRGPTGVREVVVEAGRRPERLPPALDPEIMARVDSIQEAVRRRLEALRERMQTGDGHLPPWFQPPERFDSGGRAGPDDLRPGDPREVPGFRRPPRPYSLGADYVAGARMATLNEGLAEYFQVDGGVLVVDVLDGSPAHEAGLRPGDVVAGVDGTVLESVEELRSTLLRRDEPSAGLRVVRKGRELEIQLP